MLKSAGRRAPKLPCGGARHVLKVVPIQVLPMENYLRSWSESDDQLLKTFMIINKVIS